MSHLRIPHKTRRLGLVLLVALALAQVRCDAITTPTGPEQVSVHLWGDFDEDKVVVKLDGDRVFSDRITTDHRIGIAGGIDLSVEEGVHRVQVIVNGWPSASHGFVAGAIAVIGVSYDRETRAIDFTQFVEPPLYD